MAEPLVTREDAEWRGLGKRLEALARSSWMTDEMRALVSEAACAFALDAAKDSCINRLRNGWEELKGYGEWVRYEAGPGVRRQGAVFDSTEDRAHDIADTYDRCCGCRIGLGTESGSHHIERGQGHPATNWTAIEEVARRGR